MNALTPSARRFVLLLWICGALLLALMFAVDRTSPAGRGLIKITGVDTVAYYATSRSMLFDRDFDLTNEYAALHPLASPWLAPTAATGKPGSPFPVGFPILQMPFIALGALLGGGDGYGRASFVAYYAGMIVELSVGLTALFLLLRAIGLESGASERRSNWVSFVIVATLWPTTTLGYYTFAPMAHVAAFMAACLFWLAWWRAKDGDDPRRWLPVGLSLGLLFLCRWQSVLYGVGPFVYEIMRMRSGAKLGKEWIRPRAIAAVAVALLTLPQLAQWKSVYGHWITVPQGGDFLEFPPRHALHVLFSTHHGWFTWTPIAAVGVIGLILMARAAQPAAMAPRPLALALLAAIVAQVLLIGSLSHAWTGHESFGARMLTCSLPPVAAGLAWMMFTGSPTMRRALPVIAAACGLFTVLFAAQYRLDLLPREDRLTTAEFIGDKISFRRALKRRKAEAEAQRALDDHEPARAIEVLEKAEKQAGSDRTLLDLLAQAHAAQGDQEHARDAQARLARLLEGRMF